MNGRPWPWQGMSTAVGAFFSSQDGGTDGRSAWQWVFLLLLEEALVEEATVVVLYLLVCVDGLEGRYLTWQAFFPM